MGQGTDRAKPVLDQDRAGQAPKRGPIALGSGELGVVLLHGLTGTPHEVRSLAEALNTAGYAVRAPLLSGHNDLTELERSSWHDWYASAQAAFDELWDQGRRQVVVLGFSMGSLLALRMAALRNADLKALVAVAVPLQFPSWQRGAIQTLARLRRTPVLGKLVGVLPKFGGPDIRIRAQAEASPSLNAFPYPALREMVALQDEVAKLLPHVRVPTLLVHGRLDHTAPAEQSHLVAQRLGSSDVRVEILPRSFHVVGLDLDRELACETITQFVQAQLGIPGNAHE